MSQHQICSLRESDRNDRRILIHGVRSPSQLPTPSSTLENLDGEKEGCIVPRLSIVIPALTGEEVLERGLVSLLENRPADCEIVVVNACAYSDPYALADEVRFVEIAAGSQLVDCLNLGLRQSVGDVVHFVEAGTLVQEGWSDAALAHFHDPRVGLVAPLRLQADEPQRIVSAGIDYRATGRVNQRGNNQTLAGAWEKVCPVLGGPWPGLFVRRNAVQKLDGFDKKMGDEFAAAELALRMKAAGYLGVYEPNARMWVDTSTEEATASWWQRLKQAYRNERFFWRGAAATGWIKGMFCHPWSVAAETVGTVCRGKLPWSLVGRFWGCMALGESVSYHLRLQSLRQNGLGKSTHESARNSHLLGPNRQSAATQLVAGK